MKREVRESEWKIKKENEDHEATHETRKQTWTQF